MLWFNQTLSRRRQRTESPAIFTIFIVVWISALCSGPSLRLVSSLWIHRFERTRIRECNFNYRAAGVLVAWGISRRANVPFEAIKYPINPFFCENSPKIVSSTNPTIWRN